ncbi:Sphingosine 1-phosphate receptor 1 [Trichoplax sp. H2]|nr:Sphingosine 1-phosphate receptor 1 [Trichoplax sp. H2]|eukprot:RDD45507.1 Sphingosine 1-phosphate receptor 1 [Trichoplax sp. H2]
MTVSIRYIISSSLTLLTNIWLLQLIIRCPKLRNFRNVILCSALITDIIFVCGYIIPRFVPFNEYPFDVRCGLFSRLGQCLFLSLNIHVFLLIAEIYVAISRPFALLGLTFKKVVLASVMITWTITLGIPVTFQIYIEIANVTSAANNICFETVYILYQVFTILVTSISVIVLLILLFSYCKIYSVVRKLSHNMRRLSGLANDDFMVTSDSSSNTRKVLQQIVFVFGFYLLFLGPFFVICIMNIFGLASVVTLRIATQIVQYISFMFPVFQPIILTIQRSDVREEAVRQLKYLFCCIKSAHRNAYNKSFSSSTRRVTQEFRHDLTTLITYYSQGYTIRESNV